MKLRNERTKFLEKGDADLFKVLLGIGEDGRAGINRSEVGNLSIEPDGAWLRGNLPLRGAEENADVAAVNGRDARRNRLGLKGMIDGGEEDSVVPRDVDDGAAAGQV